MEIELSREEKKNIVAELKNDLRGRFDGGEKNIICDCPECGKKDKFGIYIGAETERRKPFMANCFSCGVKFSGLETLLKFLDREDLMPIEATDITKEINTLNLFPELEEKVIDDSLEVIKMPRGFRRKFFDKYLNGRGFESDDYDYFPAGRTKKFPLEDYVIFPIIDNQEYVGWVARHTWSKKDIDTHNRKAKRTGDYKIMRYRNSEENDFINLLYNYDAVLEDETETVIIAEGILDVIGVTRELQLYDSHRVAAVATFGIKISPVQIYKLQKKGVKNVVVGYDADKIEKVKKVVEELNSYFNVFVAPPPDPEKDYGDMSFWNFWELFSNNLMTARDFMLQKIQN